MAVQCSTCERYFGTGAALNFHRKKEHDTPNPTDPTPSIEPSIDNTIPRRSTRPIIKFGKLPGAVDLLTTKTMRFSEQYLVMANQSVRKDYQDKGVELKCAESVIVEDDKESPVQVKQENEDDDAPPQLSPIKNLTVAQSSSDIEMPNLTKGTTENEKMRKKSKFPKKMSNTEHIEVIDLESSDSDEQQEPDTNPTTVVACEPKPSTSTSSSTSHVKLSEEKKKLSKRKRSPYTSPSISPRGDKDDGYASSATSKPSSSATGKPERRSMMECPVCNRTDFRNQNHYRNHLEIHERKRPYLCLQCDYGYETAIKLIEHSNIRHSQHAIFKCDKCEAQYKTSRGLENHKCVSRSST